MVLREGERGSEETAREFQNHVKATVAPYEYPRDVRFLDRLPRTSSGKIERYILSEN
jgi:2-aminobenzoate-CoA ligase